jgi:hypothetical protein
VFRAEAETLLMDPTLKSNPELLQRLGQHVDNLMSPDPRVAQQMTKFVATWMLGFRPSTAIVTATHFIIRHSAELTRMTGNPVDSFRRVSSALAEISGNVVRHRNWANEDRHWLHQQAERNGDLDQGWFTDEDSNGENVTLDFLRAVKGLKPQGVGDQLAIAGNWYSRIGMWMFQHARRMNEQAALYASFDYYREQGQSKEEAFKNASEFNHAVNPVGGRSQRPIGLFQGDGEVARTAAMMGYSLHSYSLGVLGQLGRYIAEGNIFGNSKLAPAEKYKARVAAAQMLVMQTAAAGLLGLPGVTGAMAVINQLFPQLEINKKSREWIASFMNGDPTLTDMATVGLPSMLGWDWHSRLSMGNVVPGVSEWDGFQPQQLLGPPANLMINWVTGAKKLVQGDAVGAAKDLMPSAVGDLIKVGEQSPVIKDYRGRELFKPTDGEEVGRALGFQPERLSEAETQSRIVTQAEKQEGQREGRWRQSQAEEVLKGNFGTVRQNLLSRKQQDPTYDARSGIESIARAAEDLTFPRDLSRGSKGLGTNAFLQTFPQAQPVTPEVQRLLFRTAIQQRLGLTTRPSPREMQLAQLVDRLHAASPTESIQTLRQKAEKILSIGRSLPLQEESQ